MAEVESLDPGVPATWWRLMVDAVAGLRVRNVTPAQRYLRFVEQHRGRAQAELARERLKEYRAAASWANCAMWPSWGYKPKPPPVQRSEHANRRSTAARRR